MRLLPALFLAIGLHLGLATPHAQAQDAPPTLTGPVNDFANVIDAASAQELERRIRALLAASGDTVVVATVPTFKPYGTIEEYALKMFENGGKGIGQGQDNGALIVVAVEDRQVRVEVGYELEEFITDGFAGDIIREVMRPAFRQGDYGAGILDGTTRVINRIAERRGVTLSDVPRTQAPTRARAKSRFPFGTIVWIIILVILMSRGGGGRGRRRRRWGGGPWSGWSSGVGAFGAGAGFGSGFGGFGGGGGGGGFGGFGGGSSGGGGASGSW